MGKRRNEFEKQFETEAIEVTRAKVAKATSEAMKCEPFCDMIDDIPMMLMVLLTFGVRITQELFDDESEE